MYLLFTVFIYLFIYFTEFEPESSDPLAQVLWALLCAVGGHEYPLGGDEQRPAPYHQDALQI